MWVTPRMFARSGAGSAARVAGTNAAMIRTAEVNSDRMRVSECASGSPDRAVGEAGDGPARVGGVAAGVFGGKRLVEVDAPAGFFVGVGVAGFHHRHAGEHVGFGGAAGGPFLDAEVVQRDV